MRKNYWKNDKSDTVRIFDDFGYQKSNLKLRLGAQSSYVVKYFEGSNAVKTTSMGN